MSYFLLRQLPTGFKFDLKAPNGQTIATSEVYETKAACRKGMESVKKSAPKAKLEDQTEPDFTPCTNPRFELYADRSGHFRFRLRSRNGKKATYLRRIFPFCHGTFALGRQDSEKDRPCLRRHRSLSPALAPSL